MSGPMRLDFGAGPPKPRPSWCGGALLRVDRNQYRNMEREGVRWATSSSEFRDAVDPNSGKAHARVACGNEAVQGYALCSSCSALEASARMAAREAQRLKGGQ